MDDIFADANRREDQLYDELAACPVSELTGVVSSSGVGAAKSGGQELWSLLLSFDAWLHSPKATAGLFGLSGLSSFSDSLDRRVNRVTRASTHLTGTAYEIPVGSLSICSRVRRARALLMMPTIPENRTGS